MRLESTLIPKVKHLIYISLGIQIESTKSANQSEFIQNKVRKTNQICKEEVKNYDIISGNNFTLGLKAKFSSNQSSNRNYIKKTNDKSKYSVIISSLIKFQSAKTIEVDKPSKSSLQVSNLQRELTDHNIKGWYNEGIENIDENSQSINSKERRHSSSSETFSSLNAFKDVQKVSSVVKVEKLAANNKRSANRMILYLVDKDPSEVSKRSKADWNLISHEITNDSTSRAVGGPRLKYSSNKLVENDQKLISRNSKMQIISGGDVSNDKEKHKLYKKLDLKTAGMKIKQNISSNSRGNAFKYKQSSNKKSNMKEMFRSETRKDWGQNKFWSINNSNIQLFKDEKHLEDEKQSSKCTIF